MNYTGILLVLLLLATGVIAVMFYEIMEYEADKKRWSREVKKIKFEYGKLYKTAKQLEIELKGENKHFIQNVINDIEKELTALNGITTGLEEHNRRQDLKATNKILNERLNDDKPTKANS